LNALAGGFYALELSTGEGPGCMPLHDGGGVVADDTVHRDIEVGELPRNSPIATKSSTASSVLNFMAVSRSLLLRASKMVRATSDGVGVSVSIGPPCCGVYVGKATQPVPTVPPVLAESSHHPWRRHRTRRSVPMGMIPGELAGHSLRAGLATSAAAAGVPERVIANYLPLKKPM
jgi:hypothetical protein